MKTIELVAALDETGACGSNRVDILEAILKKVIKDYIVSSDEIGTSRAHIDESLLEIIKEA